MNSIKSIILLLCIICPLLSSCGKKKSPVMPIDKTTLLYKETMSELTDSLCKNLIADAINKEIRQNIDFSECIIKVKKYPDVVYSNTSTIVGEGFFHGKVRNKRGDFFYTINLKCSNRRLKDKTAWEMIKLTINVAGKTEPFFTSGKEVSK